MRNRDSYDIAVGLPPYCCCLVSRFYAIMSNPDIIVSVDLGTTFTGEDPLKDPQWLHFLSKMSGFRQQVSHG